MVNTQTVLTPAPVKSEPPTTSDKGAVPLQSENERRPYPQFNAFRPFVMHELTRRKSTPNSFVKEITPAINAPFVRMTSCAQNTDPHNSDNNYRFFTLGLHGYESETRDIFQTSYGNGQEVVGYARRLSDNSRILVNTSMLTPSRLSRPEEQALTEQQLAEVQKDQQQRAIETNKIFSHGTHPIPGITDIRITRQGLGTALQATVQWTCYNQAQLEYCRQHFFNVGNHVVLEWGQNSSDLTSKQSAGISNDNILNFGADNIVDVLAKAVTSGRKYIIDTWVKPTGGNYDFMVGAVANFQVNLDGRTGVYTCITNIVSVSEQMWGLNNYMTYIPAKNNPQPGDNNKISTIADFFKVGGLYDALLREDVMFPELVAGQYSLWAAKNNGPDTISVEKPVDYSDSFMSNPEDFTFVSWEFLTRVLTSELFDLLDDPSGRIKPDLKSYISFFEGDDVHGPNTTAPLPLDADQKVSQVIWVGDNPYLQSTNPDTMVIIRNSNFGGAPRAMRAIGKFDESGDLYRGKLNRGVWLNSEMIRQSFLSSNTFGEAFQKILMAMNNAVANYWKLRIYFDEEVNRMRIVDEGHTDYPTRSFYKFNVGGQGECLGITFDSAFPPELVTQMSLLAKFHSESPEEQQELLDKYPLIGTTSTFAFSVNWTNLTDILDQKLAKIRESTTNNSANPTVGIQSAPATTLTQAQQAGGNVSGRTASAPTPQPGTPQGKSSTPTNASGQSADNQSKSENTKSYAPSAAYTALAKQRAEFNRRLSILITTINASLVDSAGSVHIARKNITQKSANSIIQAARTAPGPQIEATPDGVDTHVQDLAADLIIRNSDGTYGLADSKIIQFAHQDIYGLNELNPETPAQLEYIPYSADGSSGVSHQGHVQLPRSEIGATTLPTNSDAIGRSDPETTEVGSAAANKDDAITANEKAQEDKFGQYIKKFGNEITNLISFNEGAMVTAIAQDGYINGYKTRKPNSFVSPFPTTTAIGLTILGIAGMSVSDGFYVDKLPFIFERYGCFQITSIQEAITKDGWLTTLRGYFKLIYIDGKSNSKGVPPTSTLPPK